MTASAVTRKVKESAAWQAYNRSRYFVLFCALLLTLILVPTATTLDLPADWIGALVVLTLLAAVMPNAVRRTRILLPSLILLLFAVRIGADTGYVPLAPAVVQTVIGLVGLLAAAGSLRFVVRSGTVNDETIYAALSTYLLAGVFFGQIYWSIEQLAPGSIVGPEPLTEASAVYYSFVTLATLGYGDFLPRTDLARGIATFEVIGGQLYLAVMVARLIGLFGSGKAGG
jgi:hypothetical protein